MDHLTEQDAGLLEQAASMLEGLANDERNRGNCSGSEGAACSAHAIRRLAPAMLRAGHGCLAQIEEPASREHEYARMEAERNDSLDRYRFVSEVSRTEAKAFEAGFSSGWSRRGDGAAPAAVAGPALVWPDTCDGKEQEAFEAWAKRERHDMQQHPLHYLFLDEKTDAARQGWKAGLLYAVAQMKTPAAPTLEAPAAPAGDLALIVAALEHGQPQMAHYAEPRERQAQALAAARRLAAAPQAPNCTRCSGSGEDPEGYLTHGRGPDDHTVDGPCRSCDGSGAAPQAPAPGMAVTALAGEIIAALEADEKDGGYDLTSGLFGPKFSALVRRWAASEWASVTAPQAPAAPDDVLCYIRPGATLPERNGYEVCRSTDAGAMAVMGDGRVEAPAAPSGDERAAYVEFLAGKFPQTYSKEDAEHWWDRGHVSALAWQAARGAQAAPAAPAVDADPLGLRDVGEALMETIDRNADALKAVGWLGPMDCPSEIVVDLLNLLDEANTTSALGEWVATLEVDSEGGLDYETVPPCTLPAGCYPLYRAAQAKEGGA